MIGTQKSGFLLSLSLAAYVIGAVGLDQLTKIEAERNLMVSEDPQNTRIYQGERYPIFEWGARPLSDSDSRGFYLSFNFNYVRNQGAAWGALSTLDDKIRVPLFHLFTLAAVAFVLYYLWLTPWALALPRYAYGLVLSGAIGNFIDRIRLGYVIDFIDVDWLLFGWRYYYPNFNIADSCICVGVALLLIDLIFFESGRKATVAQPERKLQTAL